MRGDRNGSFYTVMEVAIVRYAIAMFAELTNKSFGTLEGALGCETATASRGKLKCFAYASSRMQI